MLLFNMFDSLKREPKPPFFFLRFTLATAASVAIVVTATATTAAVIAERTVTVSAARN